MTTDQPTGPWGAPLDVLREVDDVRQEAERRKLNRSQTAALIADAAYDRGLAEGRRQATEGLERQWGIRGPGGVEGFTSELAARRIAARAETVNEAVVSRLVGPWEPAAQQPEHAFDESSVVNPATGEPYRGSSGPEPYEPPDPLCVCGASWLGDEGCLTQQPGWTPPPPYDGPSIEELLPGGEPDEQPEGGAL